MRVGVIIVAAGIGARAGTDADLPKQYRAIAGQSVLQRSIHAFAQHPKVDCVLPVIHADHRTLFDSHVSEHERVLVPVIGAGTRRGSVLAGLRALKQRGLSHVLVHDAARPMVSRRVIDNVIAALVDDEQRYLGCLPVMPLSSTIKRSVDGQTVLESVDRADLFAAQTPQGFEFETLLRLHEEAEAAGSDQFTDDASLFEAADLDVAMVDGAESNFKITRPEDFARAELILRGEPIAARMEMRSGTGIDVHAFEPGEAVRLAEVDIPHTHRLKGHSDADAALHVLTDAILGALAEGDIGQHFPPSDAKWRGEPSRTFLSFACERVQKRGGRIVNLDLTLMCEAPKIGPHSEQMRQNIADICGVGLGRVSVKATTSEKMGFVGRSEGLLAHAIATIEMPYKAE